jgi:hypothetical protein
MPSLSFGIGSVFMCDVQWAQSISGKKNNFSKIHLKKVLTKKIFDQESVVFFPLELELKLELGFKFFLI